MSTNTIRLHRVLRTTPDKVYKAWTTAAAWNKWLPPFGYVGEVQQLDLKVGGKYRMSFTDIGTGFTHSFGGEYKELNQNERLSYTAVFDDPNLPGEMRTTVELKAVSCGTEINVVQEGVPAVIPAEQCYLGWHQSLIQLGLLVENQ
ncbi:MAG TPA: SRPBCC family protein [Pseudoduganella sp.]